MNSRDVIVETPAIQEMIRNKLLTNGIEKAQFASETPAVEAILFKDYLKSF